jgi:hypothetical protein
MHANGHARVNCRFRTLTATWKENHEQYCIQQRALEIYTEQSGGVSKGGRLWGSNPPLRLVLKHVIIFFCGKCGNQRTRDNGSEEDLC